MGRRASALPAGAVTVPAAPAARGRVTRRQAPGVPPIYVLPTRFGGAFVLVSLLTLVGCINYLLSLGYALTFLLLSVWVVCAVHASRALGRVELDLTAPERVFADAPVPLSALVHTPASAQTPVCVRLGQTKLWLESEGGQVAGTLRLPALERGPRHLPTLRLEAHDPLGLWRSSVYPEMASQGAPLLTQLLILPAPEPGAPPPPVSPRHGASAEHRRQGGDEEIAGLREYRPGDPQRRIAWKQAARLDTLLTRVYDAPVAADLALDWQGTAAAGGTEARLSRLCAWVLEAEQRGVAFSLRLPETRLELGSGEAHVRQALDLLAYHDRPALPPARRRRWPWALALEKA